MKIIHCEGKYDLKYIYRLLAYYKIIDVDVRHYNGKAQVLGKYKKDCENEYFIIDYDNGLNKKVITMINKNPNNFVVLKMDMEHFFFSVESNTITPMKKKELSEKFNALNDLELDELISSVSHKSVESLLETDMNSASNILFVLEQIANNI